MLPICSSVTSYSKCDSLFEVWPSFLSVTNFSKWYLFFQAWPIYISKCDPIFQMYAVVLSAFLLEKWVILGKYNPLPSSSKYDPFFQEWPIFPSMTQCLKCDPFSKMWHFFQVSQLWRIFQFGNFAQENFTKSCYHLSCESRSIFVVLCLRRKIFRVSIVRNSAFYRHPRHKDDHDRSTMGSRIRYLCSTDHKYKILQCQLWKRERNHFRWTLRRS